MSGDMSNEPFDPLQCARLYNAIIRTGFRRSQRDRRGDSLRRNWFEVYENDPVLEEYYDSIPPQLIPFLESIEVAIGPDKKPYPRDVLVHHLQAIASPAAMFVHRSDSIEDCLVMFPNNSSEPTCIGTVMEPGLLVTHAASEERFSPEDEDNYWYPLSDLLNRLLKMIMVGKYKAVPYDQVNEDNNPFCEGPNYWEVISWNEYILNQAVEAYEGLIEAITSRLPPSSQEQISNERAPIATVDALAQEIQGFPRAFLLKAAKPGFKFIAPGLTVYDTSDPPLSVRHAVGADMVDRIDHPYREVSCHELRHDPIVLFPSLEHQKHRDEQTGLWILPTWRWADTVKLVLPYDLFSYPDYRGTMMDYSPAEAGFVPTRATLWETPHTCPFFYEHGTRLVSILDRWKHLVESGVWTVGEEGVEGGTDFYRQASDPQRAEDFCIGQICFNVPDVDEGDGDVMCDT
ncbi:hypothetical protein BJX68DRAFT_235459 [Aspergillus pseudodeflectus]|uniref:Uncharacterized protein n=1 Tax=Aspergillus pseudodeflectus TaxID=176178 RepID=A0ABR4KK47_9EURO